MAVVTGNLALCQRGHSRSQLEETTEAGRWLGSGGWSGTKVADVPPAGSCSGQARVRVGQLLDSVHWAPAVPGSWKRWLRAVLLPVPGVCERLPCGAWRQSQRLQAYPQHHLWPLALGVFST